MTDKLIIFDTTLRDGEQSPGASMTRDEKLRIAKQLERLQGRCHRGGLSGQLQRRLRSGQGDRRRHQGVDRLRLVARQRPRHLARRRGAQGRRARAHPHLHRHLAAAHGEEAAHDARTGVRASQAGGAFRAQPDRRRGVQPRGRLPQRHGFPVPCARSRDRRRRDDHQRARHRRATPFPSCTATSSRRCASASRTATRRSGRCIATTTWAWRWPTRWPA